MLLRAASEKVEKVMTWHGKQQNLAGVWSPALMEASAAEEAQEEALLAFEAASKTLMAKRKILWEVEQRHLTGSSGRGHSLPGRTVGGPLGI